jgi:TPR repeat protein
MNNLGMRYEHGQGCEQNKNKALECYRRSAQLGYYGAMLNLGIGYERGHCNLTINLNTARMWYMKAAAQGCKISKENLDRLNGVSPILPCN